MKTAIEELIEFLKTHCNPTFCDVEYSDFILAIEHAKKQERQQIESAFDSGIKTTVIPIQTADLKYGAKYYETTFKK